MLTKLIGNPWVLGAIGFAFLGLAGLAGWYAWDADTERARADAAVVEQRRLEGQLATAVGVINENVKALADLEAQAKLDADLAADLQKQLQVSTDNQLALAQKIAALRSNPDVQNFLDTPLPPALLCVYGNAEACAGSPGSN